MSESYGYLKEFLPPHIEFDGTNRNWFYTVKEQVIFDAEKKLGFSFPSELLKFYQQIGYGALLAPSNVKIGYETSVANYILPPYISAGLYKPFEEDEAFITPGQPLEVEGYFIADDVYQDLQNGDMPVFEISDGSRYLVMRPHSDSPNAVWSHTGIKIEDSFERFIWRLYYESPTFYDDIIEAHYKALKENT